MSYTWGEYFCPRELELQARNAHKEESQEVW